MTATGSNHRTRPGADWLERLLRSSTERPGRNGRPANECRRWGCTTCGATDFRARLEAEIAERSEVLRAEASNGKRPDRLATLADGLRGLSAEATTGPHALYGLLLVMCTWYYATREPDALEGTPAGDLLARMIAHHRRIRKRHPRPDLVSRGEAG
ncbi:MAG: hypothetical protein VX726_10030 [Planctomycetota bacterium]|nr:hypothetical protein [Planctomycetota bacterium]